MAENVKLDADAKEYLDEIWDNLSEKEKKEFNSLSDKEKVIWLRYYSENETMAAGADRQRKNMVCKTCKFSGKLYSGKPTSDYTAGSCEKYDVKPSAVYFDGKECPKYVEK